jgi:pseudaminic acid biosynthesis-associated methylase
MMTETPQMRIWSGDFGRAYTDRNILTPDELDALYRRRVGIGQRDLNEEFLGALPRDTKILEVGSNIGMQLRCLQDMGFTQLYGLELQRYAVERSKRYLQNVDILQGSAFDIPFKDGFFDLVFTSGVLIHLAPDDIHRALREIYRCSRRYIWGLEYYAPHYQEVEYRGHTELLWKTDFARLYRDTFPDLRLLRQRLLPWLDSQNQDVMFLLEKPVPLRGRKRG